ncbi:metal dependent phosphohydrolase [Geothermobacter ehrlichii]|uniref:Metal dependent phosphohydrolase n=1 Tax=Geothermobacter ehrlichii TaxID=213224 RepID=A0A5D3WIB4_9BACT|nr:HD domain-containing phosphohydrolase [Geothermobacter ehrlichii]TYO97513.1 metal dependent phosphohydrolase [Geothermobacter ehrlichii]
MTDQDRPQQIVQFLAAACKGLKLYPAAHPEVKRQIARLSEQLLLYLRRRQSMRVGLLEGSLFVDQHLFTDNQPAANDVIAQLQRFDIEGLEFNRGVTNEEIRQFILVLHEGAGNGDLQQTLRARGVRHILPVRARDDEDSETPRAIYSRALDVVDRIFHDVRMGTVPSSEEAVKTVKSMVHMTLTDPHALFAMSLLKDYDNYTFTHSVNVAVLALTVGRACGLGEEKLRLLGLGALLHDIGKLKIDWNIINKPGRLTDEEFEQIKKHPTTGADLVRKMEGMSPEVIDIVLGHHLRYNREGYPADAKGKALSPLVDMATIADTYDAITTLRSYQRPMTPKQAVARLEELSGTALHPDYLARFTRFLGPYPVGSLVRLTSNEIGLIAWINPENSGQLRLRLLFDGDGERIEPPEDIELAEDGQRRIVAEVDPFSRNIDVTDYLD